MHQMNLELRFPMDEQLQLPFDFSGCGIQSESGMTLGQLSVISCGNSGKALMCSGGNAFWSTPYDIAEMKVDTIIIKSPFASIRETFKQYFKKL